LAQKYPHLKVIGVDSNPEAIILAQKFYSNIPNINFIISNNIPKDKFNVIYYNFVLHELDKKDTKKIIVNKLKESYSKLKKEGKFLF